MKDFCRRVGHHDGRAALTLRLPARRAASVTRDARGVSKGDVREFLNSSGSEKHLRDFIGRVQAGDLASQGASRPWSSRPCSTTTAGA